MEDSGETRASPSENFSKERRCRRGGKVADKKRVLVGQESGGIRSARLFFVRSPPIGAPLRVTVVPSVNRARRNIDK